MQEGCIDRLARTSFHFNRPAQAAYLMVPPRPARKAAAMASFAWMVKDFVRPLGWQRLGLPCMLAGSGMAFPWEAACKSTKPRKRSFLAEDLKQGLDPGAAGHIPLVLPGGGGDERGRGWRRAQPVAARPVGTWHHRNRPYGTISPVFCCASCKAPSLPLLAAALDLSVPPLALLALALGVDLALTLGFYLVCGAAAPAALAGALCVIFFAAISLAWWRHTAG